MSDRFVSHHGYTKEDFDYWRRIFLNAEQDVSDRLNQDHLERLRAGFPENRNSNDVHAPRPQELLREPTELIASGQHLSMPAGSFVTRPTPPSKSVQESTATAAVIRQPSSQIAGPSKLGLARTASLNRFNNSKVADNFITRLSHIAVHGSVSSVRAPSFEDLLATITSDAPSTSSSANAPSTSTKPTADIAALVPSYSFRGPLNRMARDLPGIFPVDELGRVDPSAITVALQYLQQGTILDLINSGAMRSPYLRSAPSHGLRRTDTLLNVNSDNALDQFAQAAYASTPPSSVEYYYCVMHKPVPQLTFPDAHLTDNYMNFSIGDGILGVLIRDLLFGEVPSGIEAGDQLVQPLLQLEVLQLELAWPGYEPQTTFIAINKDTTREMLALEIALEFNEWFFWAYQSEKVPAGLDLWSIDPTDSPCIPWQDIFLRSIRAIDDEKPCTRWVAEFHVDKKAWGGRSR
ncbi:hypothetical protein EIP91_001395 [Steccherinum ochraceum]|uniref:Uncharacterized protein n=1 Tax=Steccherinum ochraceum TaxID=92696 RepID=A0A4R0RUP6_9APHY|nr:hypothetical protein EIP91_001395 [Steccherinum ochraceum]